MPNLGGAAEASRASTTGSEAHDAGRSKIQLNTSTLNFKSRALELRFRNFYLYVTHRTGLPRARTPAMNAHSSRLLLSTPHTPLTARHLTMSSALVFPFFQLDVGPDDGGSLCGAGGVRARDSCARRCACFVYFVIFDD